MTISMVIFLKEFRALTINRQHGDYVIPDMVSNSEYLTDHGADAESTDNSNGSDYVSMDQTELQSPTTAVSERTRLYWEIEAWREELEKRIKEMVVNGRYGTDSEDFRDFIAHLTDLKALEMRYVCHVKLYHPEDVRVTEMKGVDTGYLACN